MCWDYTKCHLCGDNVPCTTSCGCEEGYESEECLARGHKDCKSFYNCRHKHCWRDLCDDCYERVGYCGKHVPADRREESEV